VLIAYLCLMVQGSNVCCEMRLILTRVEDGWGRSWMDGWWRCLSAGCRPDKGAVRLDVR